MTNNLIKQFNNLNITILKIFLKKKLTLKKNLFSLIKILHNDQINQKTFLKSKNKYTIWSFLILLKAKNLLYKKIP